MSHFFSSHTFDLIADALVDKGYIIYDIDDSLIHELASHVTTLQGFKEALIGRHGDKQQLSEIRSDKTMWLDEAHPIDQSYFKQMLLLQEAMNERLYMGLHYHEAHYAYYPRGSFYKKHLDAFKGRESRKLTTVLYLNEVWEKSDGGELVIYDRSDSKLAEVLPQLGRMVIFLSDSFPHEVLPATKERFSIAGWFRID